MNTHTDIQVGYKHTLRRILRISESNLRLHAILTYSIELFVMVLLLFENVIIIIMFCLVDVSNRCGVWTLEVVIQLKKITSGKSMALEKLQVKRKVFFIPK